MKPMLLALSLAVVFGSTLAGAATPASPSNISHGQFSTVLNGDWRVPQNAARDQYRHPEQTLQFFGLRTDQTVIEITPGNGWYSELLAPLLTDKGHYVAAIVAPSVSDYARKSADRNTPPMQFTTARPRSWSTSLRRPFSASPALPTPC